VSDWTPASEAEAAMRDALAAADQEHYFRILARSELLLPVSAKTLTARGPLGWGTWTTGNRTHVLAFTSPSSMYACLNEPGGSYRPVSFHALASDWPNYEWWLAVNPGLPIEAYLPSWFVSQLTRDDVRLPGRTMGARARMAQSELAAALNGRVRAEMPTITADAVPAQPIRVAGVAESPNGRVPPAEPVETVEAEIIDSPPEDSAHAYGTSGGYRASIGSFEDTVRAPGPGRGAALRETQDAEVVTPAPVTPAAVRAPEPDFIPANETESNLLAAAEGNNTDAFLSTLLLARVVLPVPRGTSSSARPRDRDFPWQIAQGDDGQRFIAVFTSPERLAEHNQARLSFDPSSISLRFVQVIAAWPGEDISFAINPGSPVGAVLPGSQIVALAAWAMDVGLRDDEPTADVVVAAKKSESTPVLGVAGAPAVGAQRATVMQRAIPHAQLAFYLERGYDRVSSFVNRASEVAHLTSPAALYRVLGLVHPGSPFAEDDAEVHVVRWVAHRSDLYRLPYGGQHEAGMRAMQGWVIERPPFRGNGFAPGDGDVVAEFKVDSVRLPHGAQIWRLAKDSTETLVATFDADTLRWTAPSVEGDLYA
jgi:SseB protein N-terminal domain